MPHIFISYRRSDSEAITGRIYDHLVDAFGDDDVFQDVESIPAGENFKIFLERKVSSYDMMLVIIGQSWLTTTEPDGGRRLDNPNDFVRIEVEAALRRPDMRVIPVLVDDAEMPRAQDLPDSLKDLHFRNAALVRHNPDFNTDIANLIDQIKHPGGGDSPTQRRLVQGVVGALILIAVIAIIGLAVLLTQSGNEPTETPAASEGQSAYIQTDRSFVNVYNEPDSDARIVGIVTNASTVVYFPESMTDGWVQIETDELSGWVNSLVAGLAECAQIADGYDAPVGTEDERRSSDLWPGQWYDANPYGTLYGQGTPIEAYHTGADLNLPRDADRGLPVYAVADGVVVFAQQRPVWGNVIVIQHNPVYTCDGEVFYTRYGHVSEVLVSLDDRVTRGQQIASVGNGEGQLAYHLHFDVSRTPGLAAFPLEWPQDDRAGLLENFVDPLEVIQEHRPPDIED